MLQRQTIGDVLERVRAERGDSPQFQKAAQFFQMALGHTEICWDDLVLEFRRNYKDAIDEIVAVLMETDDPLIIFHTLRVLDPNDPQESKAIDDIVRGLDPVKHEVGMLGLLGEPSLRAALKKKRDLPESVRAALEPSAAAEGDEEAEEDDETEEEGGGKSSGKAAKKRASKKKKAEEKE
ncbi:MAG TPA: hypothetical protein VM936_11110 [Pyrinomonadaceae bacterium]|jgi:hypothetical protein|nr:hypothetical protein [Pyrinomonadaceae bacterium]